MGKREFKCDVAKGCHHGSDDVSWSFTQAMNATATVISSGDNESHAHPRPSVVGAAGLAGHPSIDKGEDELKTPLVFSTEIARSVDVGKILSVNQDEAGLDPEDGGSIDYARTRAGSLNPKKGSRRLNGSYVVTGVVYGLVNVRTDGNTIMCATLNETKAKWQVSSFPARF